MHIVIHPERMAVATGVRIGREKGAGTEGVSRVSHVTRVCAKGSPNSGDRRKTGTTPTAVPISPASTTAGTGTTGFAFATDTGDITADEITLLRGSYFAVS